MMRFLPGLSTSLTLAGPAAFVSTLCDTRSLLCQTPPSASAFLLPFPLPLAGVSAELRCKGADPGVMKERERKINKPISWS